jgi:hypothetical protein
MAAALEPERSTLVAPGLLAAVAARIVARPMARLTMTAKLSEPIR